MSDIPTSELRRILRLLRANPELTKLVAVEMQRQRAEQERQVETIAKAVAAAIVPIAKQLGTLAQRALLRSNRSVPDAG
jgi:hypothetical protein